MRRALSLAEAAAEKDEVPVGALIVQGDTVIAEAYNLREASKCATHHAEILAIEEACRRLGGWRLPNCKLYVTLEPCPMCTGAIINSRIKRLVYGASDYKAGSCGSVVNLFDLPYNHKPEVTAGFMQEECAQKLTDFFKNLRKSKS